MPQSQSLIPLYKLAMEGYAKQLLDAGYRQKLSLNITHKVRLVILTDPLSFMMSLRRYEGGVTPITSQTEPKKCVDMIPVQFAKLMDVADFIDRSIEKKESVRRHLGHNLYLMADESFVVFRELRLNHMLGKLQSTGKTIALNHQQWARLRSTFADIRLTYHPEVNNCQLCNHTSSEDIEYCDECCPPGVMSDWYGDFSSDEAKGAARANKNKPITVTYGDQELNGERVVVPPKKAAMYRKQHTYESYEPNAAAPRRVPLVSYDTVDKPQCDC